MADSFFSGRLPVPPGINRTYKSFLNPKTGKSVFAGTPEARTFKKAAARQLKDAVVDWQVVEHIQTEKKKGRFVPLEVTIIFFYTSRWRRDIDGGIKAVQDEVFDYIGLKDNIAAYLHVEKHANKADPHTEITICIAQE